MSSSIPDQQPMWASSDWLQESKINPRTNLEVRARPRLRGTGTCWLTPLFPFHLVASTLHVVTCIRAFVCLGRAARLPSCSARCVTLGFSASPGRLRTLDLVCDICPRAVDKWRYSALQLWPVDQCRASRLQRRVRDPLPFARGSTEAAYSCFLCPRRNYHPQQRNAP